ncbi:hypothetical protein AB0M57_16875 [Streptomyces sp. NPDC051597]|uniref:hypothetical protein n=1 Tax=Streptomyces sp. NPDC051597 TaxID=3155049 RepID=UPI00341F977D
MRRPGRARPPDDRELFGYASRLRGRTRGRGAFATRPVGYAPVPAQVADALLAR